MALCGLAHSSLCSLSQGEVVYSPTPVRARWGSLGTCQPSSCEEAGLETAFFPPHSSPRSRRERSGETQVRAMGTTVHKLRGFMGGTVAVQQGCSSCLGKPQNGRSSLSARTDSVGERTSWLRP